MLPGRKNEAGLDHYQVRLCTAWYRYVTLAMLALAWLAVTRASHAGDGEQAISTANEDPPHVRRALRLPAGRAARPPLATMAPPSPAARSPLPLPATTATRSLSAAAR
jgi:hypothetical protein